MDRLRRNFQAEVDAALAKYPPGRQRSAVLELLYLAQAAYGHLTEEAVAEVAALLELDPTHIRALVGFYTLLLEAPRGHYVVQYCNDLPCALRGAEGFLDVVVDKLGCQPGETSDDGMFSLETVMCLAACDRAPMMQVNLEYYENLDEASLDALVAELRAKARSGPSANGTGEHAPAGRPPFGLGPPSEIRAAASDEASGDDTEPAGD